MVFTQTMKNCEGLTGIRNRLLRGRARNFQAIEAPRGRPFGGGASPHRNGIGTFEITEIVQFHRKSSQYFSDNSREGNATPSQSAGADGGDRHCSFRK